MKCYMLSYGGQVHHSAAKPLSSYLVHLNFFFNCWFVHSCLFGFCSTEVKLSPNEV